MLGVVAGVVAMTLAARRVLIQIPQRTMARGRMREASEVFIPLRINSAGVMPIVFAQSVIVVPGAVAQFSGNPVAQRMAEFFQPGTWLYVSTLGVLIFFFTYFYTSIIFNPIDLAENLKKQGGFIPGVKPGAQDGRVHRPGGHAHHLPRGDVPDGDRPVPGRSSASGSTCRSASAARRSSSSSAWRSTRWRRCNQHLLLRKYDGFMKKGRVRFRGRQTTGGF